MSPTPIEREGTPRATPILPVLAQQLRETRAQIEDGVVQVSSRFQGIAQRARESVDAATALLKGDENSDASLKSLVTTSHNTLENLLQRIVKGGELSMKAVYRMDDVEEGMQRIAQILADVNDVATRTRLLTVNAKIEAARVGEQGKGFAVVASEISQLSVKSAEIVVSISGILSKLSNDVNATVSDLRELASADMNEVLLGKDEVERVIGTFETKHGELEQRVRELTQNGESLAADVGGAVVGMQFQDRVSQRLEHVIEALEALERISHEQADGALPTRAAFASLGMRSTMAEEREVLARTPETSRSGSAAGDPSDTDVVLF